MNKIDLCWDELIKKFGKDIFFKTYIIQLRTALWSKSKEELIDLIIDFVSTPMEE